MADKGLLQVILEAILGLLAGGRTNQELERAGLTPGVPRVTGNLPIGGTGYDREAAEMPQRLAIVAFMRRHIGDQYTLGVEVPPGQEEASEIWDCSEIVEAAYRTQGIDMPDGSPYQFNRCRKINSPLPGDLSFLWSDKWNRIGHVMVATGDGTIVHAVGGRGVVEDPAAKWEAHPRFRGWRRHPYFYLPLAEEA